MTADRGTSVLHIDRIGADGDGMAMGADGRAVYVAFALPGETVEAGVIAHTNPDRIAPACPHFETCGGCVAQHMGPKVYDAWKRDLVVQALRQCKLEPEVLPLVRVAAASRRRASFSLVKTAGTPRLGFHKRRDTAVLPLDACAVITPRMLAALPVLGELMALLPSSTEDTRIAVADLDTGLDVVIDGVKAPTAADRRSWLAAKATEAKLARLTLGTETVLQRADVRLAGSAGALHPTPGAFFQAVAAAEQAIVDAVIAGLPKKVKRIADLFAGLGTLTLPLAKHAPVFALDSERIAIEALALAVRHATGLKPVTTRVRDLFREPLSVKELETYDTVVLDPPRAGARAQAEMLAKSKAQTVIMVSCSPPTMARDAKILVDGGFKITRVTPIDQFVWSNHVETVAVFRR